VIVGRSLVVGLPLGLLLMARDCTVTTCHSRTRNLARHTTAADILVVATGRAAMITPELVSPAAIVIDVGTNVAADGSLVGDVDPAVGTMAAGLSPVPGGIGPVTTAVLLEHTVTAAEHALRS
jgi:methylenetetrahydrofolate dehydrogenase (NADP+) / methenyltetrahydrofolate cyclohydrolase